MNDSDEILLPSGDYILVILRIQESRARRSFAPTDDTPIDPVDSSSVGTFVRETLGAHIAGPTHVVNFSIAMSTD